MTAAGENRSKIKELKNAGSGRFWLKFGIEKQHWERYSISMEALWWK
jgi:hypothetical protein